MSYGLLFAILVVGAQIFGAILKRRAEREEELKRQQRRGAVGSPAPMPTMDDGTGTSDPGAPDWRPAGGSLGGAGRAGGGADPRLGQGMSVLPSERRLDRQVLDAAGSRSEVLTGPPGSIQPRAATRDPFLDPAFGREASRMAGSPGAPIGGPQAARPMAPMRVSATGPQQPRPELRTRPNRPPAPPPPIVSAPDRMPPARKPKPAAPSSPGVKQGQPKSGGPSSPVGARGAATVGPTSAPTPARAPRPDRAPSAEEAFVSTIAPIAAGAITSASSAARPAFRGAASSAAELHALLHDRRGLRRAMILREVLGPPLATRDPLMLPLDR